MAQISEEMFDGDMFDDLEDVPAGEDTRLGKTINAELDAGADPVVVVRTTNAAGKEVNKLYVWKA